MKFIVYNKKQITEKQREKVYFILLIILLISILIFIYIVTRTPSYKTVFKGLLDDFFEYLNRTYHKSK